MSALPSHEEFMEASLEHMAKMKRGYPSMREMAALSLDDASQYADPIAKKFASVAEFCEAQKAGPDEFELWNVTSIANTAYMALHAAKHKEAYAEAHKRFVTWYSNKNSSKGSTLSSNKDSCTIL